MVRLSLAALPFVLVAGCVAAPEPATPPAPTNVAPPAMPAPAAASVDWRDWPLTPGTWRYAADTRGTRAMFGSGDAASSVVLRCDRAERRMYLARAGQANGALTIRTSSTTRALAIQPSDGAIPYVATPLASSDPLLDAMAFSRGRIVIEQTGAPTLVVPAYAEIGRVIEDCRG